MKDKINPQEEDTLHPRKHNPEVPRAQVTSETTGQQCSGPEGHVCQAQLSSPGASVQRADSKSHVLSQDK